LPPPRRRHSEVEYTPHSGCNRVSTKANSKNRQLYITMHNAGAEARGFTGSGQWDEQRRPEVRRGQFAAPDAGASIQFQTFHAYAPRWPTAICCA